MSQFCGSSPRVWGIPAARHGEYKGLQPQRFIPTRVGNTVWSRTCWMARLRRFIPTRVGNTSLVGGVVWVVGLRFIPTRVGNTVSSLHSWDLSLVRGSSPRVWGILCLDQSVQRWRVPPVHPHACGEYWISINNVPDWRDGSSPRVWGIRTGSSASTAGHGSPPRVWEYLTTTTTIFSGFGSPPRVWGILSRSPTF